MVETSADAFFEGAWDGPFSEFGFLASTAVMGSGGRVSDGVVGFCSPTHTLDNLYCLRTADAVFVANSFALLLARTEDAPDLRYRHYRRDIAALWRGGVPASPLSLPTARGHTVLVYAGTDLVVAPDLSVVEATKPQPSAPDDYAAYYQVMSEALAGIVANGTDQQRRTPMHALTTMTSGYDSTATSVLGANAGVKDAVTLQNKRFDDSGGKIAASLGLDLTVLDREAWRQSERPLEIEFMASNGGPAGLALAAIEDRWRAPMVLLGSLGDQLWDRRHPKMGENQSIPDGLSLTPFGLHDFRLRAGVTFVHVPAITAMHAGAIHRISLSDEMQPWAVSKTYDRPVPRRIVEDAGIARTAFATKKRAGAAVDPEDAMRPPAQADFEQFWQSTLRALPFMVRMRFRMAERIVAPTIELMRKALWRIRSRPLQFVAIRRSLGRWYFYRSIPLSYQFHWAVQRLTDTFATDLEGGSTDHE